MSSSSTPDPPPHLDLADIEEDELEVEQEHERALGEKRGAQRERGGSWVTLAWAAPGFLWLGFFLIAPLVFIVLMSFWTPDTSVGFVKDWTTQNYSDLLHPFNLSNAYWKDMWRSFQISAIAVVACLVFGFPVAYFLAMKVEKLQYQIALFILALAPFWTSFITRSVAWAYPLMGTYGALNRALVFLGISSYSHPLLNTQFTQLSVQLAMIQLYILFMVTPIFIFVLTMGEYGTVQVISQGAVTTVGVYIQTQIVGTQYPQGAASAVLLVLILILGVFAITRFSNLREDI